MSGHDKKVSPAAVKCSYLGHLAGLSSVGGPDFVVGLTDPAGRYHAIAMLDKHTSLHHGDNHDAMYGFYPATACGDNRGDVG